MPAHFRPLFAPTVTVTTASLPGGTTTVAYSQQLAAIGGTTPYIWYIVGGALPNGIGLNAAGLLSGTPTVVGSFTFTVQAQDFNGLCGAATFTVQVVSGTSVGTWFGATLPTLPTQFSTTSNPPAPAATNRGSYYTPGVGGDAGLTLQAAINAAAAAAGTKGDVVVAQAGTTYTTNPQLTLPARTGSGTIYIIASTAPEIGGSGLPFAGVKVTPANIPSMASLRTTAANGGPVVNRASGAGVNGYRLVGLDIELTDANASAGTTFYVVTFFASDTSIGTLASNITLDRCYIAGAPNAGVLHGIRLEGVNVETTECYIERCWQQGNGDNQCIFATNSTGPYKIHNNYVEAQGETTLVGGADTTLPQPTEPSDITITNNHYFKNFFSGTGSVTSGSTTLTITAVGSGKLTPAMAVSGGFIPASTVILSQLTGTTGGTGTYQMNNAATGNGTAEAITAVPTGKNMVEFKTGDRVLFDSNFMENAGAPGQARSAFTLTCRNNGGTNPWYALLDFTVTNNIFTNCTQGGISILLQDGPGSGVASSAPSHRILFRNNIFMLSSVGDLSFSFSMCGILSALQPGNIPGSGGDLVFDHNTFIAPVGSPAINSIFGIGGGSTVTLNNVVWSNNYFDPSQNGIMKLGSPSNYAASVLPQVSQPAFINNVVVGSTDATIPGGNFKPANTAAVGFTNYGSVTAAAGYQLTTSSPYHGAGVSGLNLPFSSSGTPDGTDIGCNVSALPVLATQTKPLQPGYIPFFFLGISQPGQFTNRKAQYDNDHTGGPTNIVGYMINGKMVVYEPAFGQYSLAEYTQDIKYLAETYGLSTALEVSTYGNGADPSGTLPAYLYTSTANGYATTDPNYQSGYGRGFWSLNGNDTTPTPGTQMFRAHLDFQPIRDRIVALHYWLAKQAVITVAGITYTGLDSCPWVKWIVLDEETHPSNYGNCVTANGYGTAIYTGDGWYQGWLDLIIRIGAIWQNTNVLVPFNFIWSGGNKQNNLSNANMIGLMNQIKASQCVFMPPDTVTSANSGVYGHGEMTYMGTIPGLGSQRGLVPCMSKWESPDMVGGGFNSAGHFTQLFNFSSGSVVCTGSISGTTMALTVPGGSPLIASGDTPGTLLVSGVGVTPGTTIQSQASGAAGQSGNYVVAPSQNVPSTTLTIGNNLQASVMCPTIQTGGVAGANWANDIRPAINANPIPAANQTFPPGYTVTPGATQIFNFPNFSNTTGLTIQNDCNFVGGACSLTRQASGAHQSGGMSWNTQVNVSNGFTTDFTFQFPQGASFSVPTIVGFNFNVQNTNSATNAVFGPGASSDANCDGYSSFYTTGQAPASAQEMQHSIGIKFALDALGNPSPNVGVFRSGGTPSSTGFYVNGASPNLVPENDLQSFGFSFYNTHVFAAHVVYDGNTTVWTIRDTTTGAQVRFQAAVNIPAAIGGSNTAWVGFAGGNVATSTNGADINILSWRFSLGFNTRLATPTLGVPGGQYATSQSVAISAPSGATIYYTTNGLTPTSSSTLYTGPVTVSTNTFLQAIAVQTGFTDSLIASANYLIQASGQPTVNFPSGFASSGNLINLCGAAFLNSSSIELCDNVRSQQVAAAWYVSPVTVSGTWATSFTLAFTNLGGNGMCFVIQNQPPSSDSISNGLTMSSITGQQITGVLNYTGGPYQYGNVAGGLGYSGTSQTGSSTIISGFTRSVAVTFKGNNAGGSLSGVFTGGADVSGGGSGTSPCNFKDNPPVAVTISYSGGVLTVSMTDNSSNHFSYNTTINIPNVVGANTAYVGFVAATGGTALQSVTNWIGF